MESIHQPGWMFRFQPFSNKIRNGFAESDAAALCIEANLLEHFIVDINSGSHRAV